MYANMLLRQKLFGMYIETVTSVLKGYFRPNSVAVHGGSLKPLFPRADIAVTLNIHWKQFPGFRHE